MKRTPAIPILFTASLPFIAKAAVLGTTGYAAQSLYKIVQLAIPVAWRHREGKKGIDIVWPFDEPRPTPSGWATGALTAVVLAAIGTAVINLAASLGIIDPQTVRSGLDQRFSVDASLAVLVVIFLSTFNAALEELHFRAWMDRELSALWGKYAGIGVSALAFGSMHILIFWGMPGFSPYAVFLMAGALAIAGAVWSVLMRMKGGIHIAFISHSITDALLLTWGLYWLGYL